MMKTVLTREQKIEILGKIGEKYVGNYLAKKIHRVSCKFQEPLYALKVLP